MTANDLKAQGVKQRHIEAFKQLRASHTHLVTEMKLDLHGIGGSLRKLREDADISLRGMAKLIGLSPAFLSDCELGERRLSLGHALLFLKHCNV